MTPQAFLLKASAAARAAQHIFPEYAACEAALESGWGRSLLAQQANNLFGQKQTHPPTGASLSVPTREYLHGAWTTVAAEWIVFPDWESCFRQRMAVLRRLAADYPHYQAALAASTGDAFVAQVSKSWSTDPERAQKVLSVFRAHLAARSPELVASA